MRKTISTLAAAAMLATSIPAHAVVVFKDGKSATYADQLAYYEKHGHTGGFVKGGDSRSVVMNTRDAGWVFANVIPEGMPVPYVLDMGSVAEAAKEGSVIVEKDGMLIPVPAVVAEVAEQSGIDAVRLLKMLSGLTELEFEEAAEESTRALTELAVQTGIVSMPTEQVKEIVEEQVVAEKEALTKKIIEDLIPQMIANPLDVDLQAQLKAAQATIATLETQLDNLANAKSLVDIALAETQAALDQAEANYQGKVAELEQAFSDLNDYELEVEGLEEKIGDLEFTISELTTDIIQLNAQIAAFDITADNDQAIAAAVTAFNNDPTLSVNITLTAIDGNLYAAPKAGKTVYDTLLVQDLTKLANAYNAIIDVETYDSYDLLPDAPAENTVAKVPAGSGYTKYVFYDGDWVTANVSAYNDGKNNGYGDLTWSSGMYSGEAGFIGRITTHDDYVRYTGMFGAVYNLTDFSTQFSALAQAITDGYRIGYKDGYDDGYDAGYKQGFVDGVASVSH